MATPRLSVSTPSPPPNIHTPPTPKHGFGDSWEPFSPRKSSRLASAAAASKPAGSIARTPSPCARTRRAANGAHSRQLRSPRPRATAATAATPEATPRKKKTPSVGFAEEDGAKGKGLDASHAASLGMLPTPAKTPSKKQHAASQNESNIAAIARNLFHTDVDEVMASPSKKGTRSGGKKYTGFTLESFTQEEEEPITIFTDSQDRVPEADASTENPFYGDGAANPPPTPVRRRSKRNQVSIPGEGRQSVEDASRREDGIVYVFRGKKIFRKFEDSAAAQEEAVLEGLPAGRRLTRSAMKPRLLFPRDEAKAAAFERPQDTTTDDEEALTDIEDQHAGEMEEEEEEEPEPEPVCTPFEKTVPNTPPNAPRFAPVSPPITGRTTRSGHRAAEEPTPVRASTRNKKRSPFDGWRQTKSSASAAAAGHKRVATDDLAAASPVAAKRSRM